MINTKIAVYNTVNDANVRNERGYITINYKKPLSEEENMPKIPNHYLSYIIK